ncbi:MAG TPA: DUF1501 domain-containing protein [Isosphaeraceae bacterium]|nr:DUF1501 domain-containing protein [Isosphaeraceae bacterium]
MLTVTGGTARTCSGFTRREFLKAGGLGLGAFGLTLGGIEKLEASAPERSRAVILIMLVGGPSQLETWDPKPDAAALVRGPFASIPTALSGVRFNEHLPRLAKRMGKLAVLRSLYHDAAPIHETGHQLLQTGRLCRLGQEHPHVGSCVARLQGSHNDLPPFVIVPGPIGNTGVGVSHGQAAGPLGPAFDPFVLDADPAAANYDPEVLLARSRRFLDGVPELPVGMRALSERVLSQKACSAFDLAREPAMLRAEYGHSTFGQSCLLARRLVEAGVRLVTVNMFETVFNRVTWDCHGSRPFSTLEDYARELLPGLDQTVSALLDDLDRRGLLETTLVVATGEFGRTPKLNSAGGRDHWPGVWSALLAGGGIQGGQVIGASDAIASEPTDRPITPPQLLATIYKSLGIDPSRLVETAAGESVALLDSATPVSEAFA